MGIIDRIRNLWRSRELERDLDDEVVHHLEMRTQDLIAQGMEPTAARATARRAFGNQVTIREDTRRSWGFSSAESLWMDVRSATRTIAAHPWFSTTVIVTLALGIGVNTAVFTLVNAVVFKPLPFPGGDRIVVVRSSLTPDDAPPGRVRGGVPTGISFPDYRAYRDQASSFERLEAVDVRSGVLSEGSRPADRVRIARVTAGVFDMVNARPALGRAMTPADANPDSEAAIWLSDGVWQSRYGGDLDVVGRVVRLDGAPATIAGVMPPGFGFPNREQLWTPLGGSEAIEDREVRPLEAFGMLKTGVTPEQADADLGLVAARLAGEFPATNRNIGATVQTFQDVYNGDVQSIFLWTLAAVGLVLLIACANVANVMLGRALERRREVAIRAAMGASRWRIARQLLVESIVLSLIGGAVGLALSGLGALAFDRASARVEKPYWVDFSMDLTVFAYCAAVCVATGVLFGLAPALRASRTDLNAAFESGGRTAGSRRDGRLSAVLTVAQFALAVVLLAGAGLFVQSMYEVAVRQARVPAAQVLIASLSLPGDRYPDPDDRRRFYEAILPAVASLPGVERAALTSSPPHSGGGIRRIEIANSGGVDAGPLPQAIVVWQSPGYLDVIDVPIVAGRDLEFEDGVPGREEAIVTSGFARRFWPDEQALGKQFRLQFAADAFGPWTTVVGVSGDLVQGRWGRDTLPVLLLPLRQRESSGAILALRSAGDPMALAPAVRAEVQRIDQDLPASDIRTIEDLLGQSTWPIRIFGVTFAVFAAMALVLASVGVYGVVAQATGRRTHEIGIRLALGATRTSILRLVLGRGAMHLLIGVGLGIAGVWAVTRVISTQVFGISSLAWWVLFAVPAILAAVGLFACWLPARRATAVSPLRCLRYE